MRAFMNPRRCPYLPLFMAGHETRLIPHKPLTSLLANCRTFFLRGTPAARSSYRSMKYQDKFLIAAMAVVVSFGAANAQTSGSGGTSSGTTGGATSSGAPGGSPALGSTPTGPLTPNRSNSVRTPRPQGSIPDTSTTTPSDKSGTGTGSNAQDRAALGSGRVPSPATGGAGGSTKKNPASETVEDCLKLWDAGTHMSRAEWARSCRRVQGRPDLKQ